jgi:hypothetical protein
MAIYISFFFLAEDGALFSYNLPELARPGRDGRRTEPTIALHCAFLREGPRACRATNLGRREPPNAAASRRLLPIP